MTDASAKLKVFVRCRPPSPNVYKGKKVINHDDEKVVIGEKGFIFDSVFHEKVDQLTIYQHCVQELILGCFEGYNATVFAYGQTGSGKTHSMIGDYMNEDDQGIVPRALSQIFHYIHFLNNLNSSATTTDMDQSQQQQQQQALIPNMRDQIIVNLRIGFLEIYNDDCKDLLHQDIPSRDIMIREDKVGNIIVTGAREEVVTTYNEAIKLLEYGIRTRTTAETSMNAVSSRSHAIFTISFEIIKKSLQDNTTSYIQSKLHLVDLAGSERVKRTLATGARFKESVGINQGLLTLGKVIRALTAKDKNAHIPYRDSKLTRFLQDSLGGNSNTVMLACISTTEDNIHETLSTLQYACRARAIQNKIVANITDLNTIQDQESMLQLNEMQTNLINTLREQINTMEMEMVRIKDYNVNHPPGQSTTAAAGDKLVRASWVGRSMNGNPMMMNTRNSISATASTKQILVDELDTMIHTLVNAIIQAETVSTASLPLPPSNHTEEDSHSQVLVNYAENESERKLKQLLHHNKHILEQLNKIKKIISSLSFPNTAVCESDNTATVEELESKIQVLQDELEECHEDLKRDEEIFGAKVKELKQAKKMITILESEIHKFKQLYGPLTATTTTTTHNTSVSASNNDNHNISSSPVYPTSAHPLITSQEDQDDVLNITRAVIAAEPDISQLIEDVEAITAEKDILLKQAKSHPFTISQGEELIKSHNNDRLHINQLADTNQDLKIQNIQLLEKLKVLNDQQEVYQATIKQQDNKLQILTQRVQKLNEEKLLHDNSGNTINPLGIAAVTSSAGTRTSAVRAVYTSPGRARDTSTTTTTVLPPPPLHMNPYTQNTDELTHKTLDEYMTTTTTPLSPFITKESLTSSSSSSSTSRKRNQLPTITSTTTTTTVVLDGSSNVSSRSNQQVNSDIIINHQDFNWTNKSIDNLALIKSSIAEIVKLQTHNYTLSSERNEYMKEFTTLKLQYVTQKTTINQEYKQAKQRLDKLNQDAKKSKQRLNTYRTQFNDLNTNKDKYTQENTNFEEIYDKVKKDMSYEVARLGELVNALKSQQVVVDRLKSSSGYDKVAVDNDGDQTAEYNIRVDEIKDEIERVDIELQVNQKRIREELMTIQSLYHSIHQSTAHTTTTTTTTTTTAFDQLMSQYLSYTDQVTAAATTSNSSSENKTNTQQEILWDALYNELNNLIHDGINSIISNIHEEDENIVPKTSQEIRTDEDRCKPSNTSLKAIGYLIEQLLDVKYKSLQEGDLVKQLKGKLEESKGNLEELQTILNKTKNDYIRKQDAIKQENENKVLQLVQQIRKFESDTSLMSPSLLQGYATSVSKSQVFTNMKSVEMMNTVPQRPQTALSRGTSQNNTSFNRGVNNILPSPRRLSDAQLNQFMRQSLSFTSLTSEDKNSYDYNSITNTARITPRLDSRKTEINMGTAMNDDGEAVMSIESQEEVLRRWLIEKERREQLEKRNSELFTELRSLRNQVNSEKRE